MKVNCLAASFRLRDADAMAQRIVKVIRYLGMDLGGGLSPFA
jgi:hypothetical protein